MILFKNAVRNWAGYINWLQESEYSVKAVEYSNDGICVNVLRCCSYAIKFELLKLNLCG